MNNNDGVFLKLLLPAIFLILWALSQLFNKESQASANRPGSALGPRPGGLPPAPRPSPVQREAMAGAPGPLYRGKAPGNDDDIMIIRSETTRPGAQAAQRRAGRGRPGGGTERPAAARSAGGRPQRREPRPESRPTPSEPPKLAPPSTQPAPSEAPILIGVSAPLSSESIRQMMSSRDRVREAIILNEILQPPVALRGSRGRRP